MMLIRLSNEEFRNLKIEHAETETLGEDYRNARDDFWEKAITWAHATGKELWNGEVYTLEDIEPLSSGGVELVLGRCEYKDIVFKFKMGVESLAITFGKDVISPHASVCCIPRTIDGKYLFGVRAENSTHNVGNLGLVGGSMNHDECEVRSWADIETMMRLELEEELAIEDTDLALHFLGFVKSAEETSFVFTCDLNLGSQEIGQLFREGEFSELRAVTGTEFVEMKDGLTNTGRLIQGVWKALFG